MDVRGEQFRHPAPSWLGETLRAMSWREREVLSEACEWRRVELCARKSITAARSLETAGYLAAVGSRARWDGVTVSVWEITDAGREVFRRKADLGPEPLAVE